MTDKPIRRHLSALRGDRLARIFPEDGRGGRRHSNFIPRRICTCGRRGRRPSNRSRDNYTICPNPRRAFLEGRRPRRLVATRDINRVETFVPATWRGTGLGARYVNTPHFPHETFVPVGTGACVPPIRSESRPETSITSKYSHPQPGGAPASVPVTSTRHISRMKHLYPWAPRPVPLQLNAQQSYLEGRRAVSPETSRGGASQALHGL